MSGAKQPIALLAGGHGHPVHPALVAIPIGSWVCSLVFDIASRFVDDGSGAAHAAWWLLAIGVIGAVIAAMAGFLDFFVIPPTTRVWCFAVLHLSLVLLATVLFAIDWLGRRADPSPVGGTPAGYLVLSVVGLLVLLAGGYLGGELAYRFGVRVSDEATQAAGYER